MEIRTTVRDFSEQIKYHHISPDTCIRVIVDELEPVIKENDKTGSQLLPVITPEEQRYRLNLMPNEYDPEGSEELIKIIEESHTNTDSFHL
ncbi:MAG: hypothetical protein GY862_22130 [Gammaproteobacteria bacterium]|nr:hypothetical protein [Gammaproteobacteria bacterium]